MRFLSFFLLFILSNSSVINAQRTIINKTKPQKCDRSVKERLSNHFYQYEIRPDLIVNNNDYDFGPVESKTRTINLANHIITWITTVSKNDVGSTIKIDNETIYLQDKISINPADGEIKIEFDWVNDWDQIKLYKLGNHEIIGITLIPLNCTGLMCSVSAQLIYDVNTKAKSFFGGYQTDREIKLFRYGSDDTPYYVSRSFDGDPHGVTSPGVITFELYKIQSNGQFRIQQDAFGKKYFIKHTMFPDMEIDGDTVKPKKKVQAEKFEQNWIKKID